MKTTLCDLNYKSLLTKITLGILISASFPILAQNKIPPSASAKAESFLEKTKESSSELIVTFKPTLTFNTVTLSDGEYTRVIFADGIGDNQPGKPDLPRLSRLIAIPQNAVVSVEASDVVSHTLDNITILPGKPQSHDKAGSAETDIIWKANEDAYAVDSFMPQNPVSFQEKFNLHGIRTGILRMHPAIYNPAKKQLKVFDSIRIKLTFSNPDKTQKSVTKINMTEADLTRFSGYLNTNTVINELTNIIQEDSKATEFLIIAHGDFSAAARSLANWKNSIGINTKVVTLDKTGSTATDIAAYIKKSRRSNAHLKYILLFGDAEFIPTHEVEFSSIGTSLNSDIPYFDTDGDFMPEFAYGRIPVDTPDQADTVVNKIIDYEKTPPANPGYYKKIGFAGYFTDINDQAHMIIQDVDYYAREKGSEGNNISIQYVLDAKDTAYVTLNDLAITVHLVADVNGESVTTAEEIDSVIHASDAADFVSASAINKTAVQQPMAAPQFLDNGDDSDGIDDYKDYVHTLETVRNSAVAAGKTDERLYLADQPWTETNPLGPVKYATGEDVPLDLRYYTSPDFDATTKPQNLDKSAAESISPATDSAILARGINYPWDADVKRIVDLINQGVSIFIYRGHGDWDHWFDPHFENSDIPLLNNGDTDPNKSDEDMYPVVFSIACNTGMWENEIRNTPDQESFAEVLLRHKTGGATSIIAATGDTDRSMNDLFLYGMSDAFWPRLLSSFGSDASASPRLGDVFLNGATYLLQENDWDHSKVVIAANHIIGDPTLVVWLEKP